MICPESWIYIAKLMEIKIILILHTCEQKEAGTEPSGLER